MRHPSVTLLAVLVLLLPLAMPSRALQLQGALWSPIALYQGDVGSVTLTFYVDNAGCGCLGIASQTYVKAVGIQFDWQKASGGQSEVSVGQNLTSGSIGTYTLPIMIPRNISAGPHAYSVFFVDGSGVTLHLYAGTVTVHDVAERTYDQELPGVQLAIRTSTLMGFRSAQALSLLSQAQEAFDSAEALATGGSFRSALTQLNASSSLLSQAKSAESAYASRGSLGSFTFYGITGFVVGVTVLTTGIALTVGLILLLKRRYRR